jgi:hypothetical protein
MESPQPFIIQRVLVLQGGCLKKSMQLACELVDNHDLIKLNKSDMQLARAVGQKAKGIRSPFDSCDIFWHMQKLRNDAVDRFIREKMHSADPMADEAMSSADISSTNRGHLFHEHSVPQILGVTFPAFTTPEGKRLDETTIKMLTTPKKIVSPSMEATAANMDWFMHACQFTWKNQVDPDKKRKLADIADLLVDLPWPVKVIEIDEEKVRLGLYYKCGGTWKMRTKKLERAVYTGRHDDLCHAMMAVAETLLAFRVEWHEEGPEHE